MWTWTNYNDELYHHGIKGQKWGLRRYQNEDRSYTPAGRKRYSSLNMDNPDQYSSEYERYLKHPKISKIYSKHETKSADKTIDDYNSGLIGFQQKDDKYNKLRAKVNKKGYGHTDFFRLVSDGDRLAARGNRLQRQYNRTHKKEYHDYKEARSISNQEGAKLFKELSSFIAKDLAKRYPEAGNKELLNYQNWLLDDILLNR